MKKVLLLLLTVSSLAAHEKPKPNIKELAARYSKRIIAGAVAGACAGCAFYAFVYYCSPVPGNPFGDWQAGAKAGALVGAALAAIDQIADYTRNYLE